MFHKKKIVTSEFVRANAEKSVAEITSLIKKRGGHASSGYVSSLKSRAKRESAARYARNGNGAMRHHKPRRPQRLVIVMIDEAIAEGSETLAALRKARSVLTK